MIAAIETPLLRIAPLSRKEGCCLAQEEAGHCHLQEEGRREEKGHCHAREEGHCLSPEEEGHYRSQEDGHCSHYEAGWLAGESWAWDAAIEQLGTLLANAGAWRTQLAKDAFRLGWLEGALAVAEAVERDPCCSQLGPKGAA